MKRFIDLRHTDVGGFAWYDTITDQFETHSGSMTWDNFLEFAEDYEGDELERYKGLVPKWTFEVEIGLLDLKEMYGTTGK